CPELEVAGVSLPGTPGVIIGHNAHIAWGLTAAYPDTQDLYLEELDPADPSRYRTPDGWQRARLRREEVHVKGARAPRLLEVIETRHGPIVNRLLALPGSRTLPGLALRWVGQQPNMTFRAILKLDRARDWDQFRAALTDWHSPAMNVVYADVEGHIGYQM